MACEHSDTDRQRPVVPVRVCAVQNSTLSSNAEIIHERRVLSVLVRGRGRYDRGERSAASSDGTCALCVS